MGALAFFMGGCARERTTAEDALGEAETELSRCPSNPEPPSGSRIVTADVVAIDQVYVYNRFGSFNPGGMIYALKRDVVPIDPGKPIGPGNAMLREDKRPRPLVLRANVGDTLTIRFTNWLAPERVDEDQPFTRQASVHVNGLEVLDLASLGGNVGKNPSALAKPGETRVYRLFAAREGTFFMHSGGAMTGGEGLGGQTVQGLFGAVNVEPVGAVWYRSQVTAAQLAAASRPQRNADGTPRIDYDAEDAQGVPILRILDDQNQIVHSDLNAIVAGYDVTDVGTPSSVDQGVFREMTIVFHDELNAVQAFPELDEPQFHGVRDGFAINYGAAGLGAELLANRKRIGPTKNCVECRFEEFFLSSWAGGDPALNVEKNANGVAERALFPDDPSNVHHAYLGDPVRMRNLHGGPKETHVFHLHAHQWLHTPNGDKSTYLDSQTLGPAGAYTYDINYGGAGNRNFTAGDAIFHCHLYPHFAQGMWELFRVHDVFESGTPDRNLPDGEIAQGTPNPALVPLPERAMPPMPTPEFRGYPFYVGAIAGHRPSQPPLDIEFDGGLQRHLITKVQQAELGARGQFDVEILKANVKLLPPTGTPPEKRAMDFHAGAFPGSQPFTTIYGFPARSYPAFTPEGAPARFVVNGHAPQPGAPYADPCPAGSPERDYRAAYVQLDGVVNQAGWHDKQMRITVLEGDAAATLNKTRPPEPFFVRANSGECINYAATNLLPDSLAPDDFQIFTPTDVVGQHIHLVKFDVTSSDGSGNGWNYEDGTLGAQSVQEIIDAANAAGGAFAADGDLQPGMGDGRVYLRARANPRVPLAQPGAQTTVQRWWADPLLDKQGHDRTIRTCFSHDHFAPSSHQHHGLYAALVIEPAGSTWRDPGTGQLFGTRPDGGPTSFRADILTPAASDSYREFNLALADFAIVYDAYDKPVNPPNFLEVALPIAIAHKGVPTPEAISAGDPGTMLINYRNEPLPLRLAKRKADGTFNLKPGPEGKMENVFRSAIHGDPFTPILPVYERDKVQIRLIQGAQEEQHVFSLNGRRWLHEPSDPDSGFVNTQAMGISEHFEALTQNFGTATKNADGSVDYMYQSTPTDDLWNGMWGLVRAYGKKIPSLQALPSNPPPATLAQPTPVCPANAPVRAYEVHAITAKGNLPGNRLSYNERFKLYDPDAILFVKEENLAGIRSGARKPEPLILRASAGECVEVTLVNELPQVPPKTPHWNYNPPITELFNTNQVPSSNNVSLHPQLVSYDVNLGDGANIGQNQVQTIAPGETRTYRWYAGTIVPNPADGQSYVPVEYGVVNLRDMADVVNHGMHGAVGTLIIEPQGASWVSDAGMEAQAVVQHTDGGGYARSFREHVVVFQDEIGMHSDDPRFQCQDDDLNCCTAIRNIGGEDDAEDTGHKAFNFRTEPIGARLGLPPETDPNVINDRELAAIMSSLSNGDPATPLFTARRGQQQRFRLAQPSGHARQHSFKQWGAEWPNNPFAAGSGSRVIGPNPQNFTRAARDGQGPMRPYNVVPLFGAGGKYGVTGDFLYLDQESFSYTQGLWGILRVTP
ncbi:manganese oxidation [Minicystis rosea]|nr:manganese oxidation [Minicystis rosea]